MTSPTPACEAERFLEHGRLVRTPRRLDDRTLVLEHLAARLLAPGEAAPERALTAARRGVRRPRPPAA